MSINTKNAGKLATLLLTSFCLHSAHAAEPVSVSASADDGNIASNTLDNNLNTRWSAKGDGQSIEYDLGTDFIVNDVDLAFFRGNQRFATFDIEVSVDAENWLTVFSGTQETLTLDPQTIDVDDTVARFVRIVGHGNSSNDWNSLTTVSINTSTIENSSPNEDSKNHILIPASIQAEAFTDQNGVKTESTNDIGGGENVGFIQNGDFTEYLVTVPSSGTYTFEARVASKTKGGVINVESDGDNAGAIEVNGTGGWQSWTTVKSDIELNAGDQSLRLTFSGGSGYLLNINSFSVTLNNADPVEAAPVETSPVDDNEENSDKPNANIFTLEDLREAIGRSNQNIVMSPGKYNITDLPSSSRSFNFSGSNNTVDLVGVHIEVPVGSTARESYITMEGNNNTLLGGTFEDIYTNGMTQVSDFVRYNNDADLSSGLKGDAVMHIIGDDNVIDGIKMTVRGSFPYGYGSIFGIGRGSTFGLNKRCGILVTAEGTTIQNSELQLESFCHGIYMQSPADNTLIRNVLVEGDVRATNDMLQEGPNSLPFRNDYKTVDGDAIEADEVNSLSEDGIRVYSGGGSVVVENSTVKKMRGGFRLYLASSATVSNSTAVDCGATNYNMPKGGKVTNSSGNFTFAPLSDFRLSRSNQDLDMTILPSPNAVGSHNIADILGGNHDIVFRRADGPQDSDEERVIVVYGNGSTIRNETEYTIVLNAGTRDNIIISAGDVIDNGSNSVNRIALDL